MESGRELDVLVAKKIMDWHIEATGEFPWGFPPNQNLTEEVPNYSTEIAEAWEVVGKVSCNLFQIYWEDDFGWKAQFNFWDSNNQDFKEYVATGDTASHAICLAALKAIGS